MYRTIALRIGYQPSSIHMDRDSTKAKAKEIRQKGPKTIEVYLAAIFFLNRSGGWGGVLQSEQNLCVTTCEDDKFIHTDTMLAVHQCKF